MRNPPTLSYALLLVALVPPWTATPPQAAARRPNLVFILTDNQIIDERFLVYVNDLLSTGYIADLFTAVSLHFPACCSADIRRPHMPPPEALLIPLPSLTCIAIAEQVLLWVTSLLQSLVTLRR